jgi:hypothetical protein
MKVWKPLFKSTLCKDRCYVRVCFIWKLWVRKLVLFYNEVFLSKVRHCSGNHRSPFSDNNLDAVFFNDATKFNLETDLLLQTVNLEM